MKREKKNRTDVIGRKWSSSSSSLYFIPNCGFVKVCQWKPSIYPCSNFFFLSFFYYYYDYFLAKQPIRFLVCLLAYLFIKLGCADTDFFFFELSKAHGLMILIYFIFFVPISFSINTLFHWNSNRMKKKMIKIGNFVVSVCT